MWLVWQSMIEEHLLVDSVKMVNNHDLIGEGQGLLWWTAVSLAHSIASFNIRAAEPFIKSNIILVDIFLCVLNE